MSGDMQEYYEKRVDDLNWLHPDMKVIHKACIDLGTLVAATAAYQDSRKYKN